MRRIRQTPKAHWKALIKIAEAKIERSRLKTQQLEALLADFRAQAKAGKPCPTEIAELGTDLSKLLQ
jgi:hypothetical protein